MSRNVTTTSEKSERLLRRALFANAGFSTLCAAACLLATGAVASFTGLASSMVLALGVDLGAFAAGLLVLLSRDLSRPWPRRLVGAVIAMDVLWVVGSAAVLAMPTSLTVAGQWTVGLVALAVADLAFFQWRGWRGMAAERGPRAAFEAELEAA